MSSAAMQRAWQPSGNDLSIKDAEGSLVGRLVRRDEEGRSSYEHSDLYWEYHRAVEQRRSRRPVRTIRAARCRVRLKSIKPLPQVPVYYPSWKPGLGKDLRPFQGAVRDLSLFKQHLSYEGFVVEDTST